VSESASDEIAEDFHSLYGIIGLPGFTGLVNHCNQLFQLSNEAVLDFCVLYPSHLANLRQATLSMYPICVELDEAVKQLEATTKAWDEEKLNRMFHSGLFHMASDTVKV